MRPLEIRPEVPARLGGAGAPLRGERVVGELLERAWLARGDTGILDMGGGRGGGAFLCPAGSGEVVLSTPADFDTSATEVLREGGAGCAEP